MSLPCLFNEVNEECEQVCHVLLFPLNDTNIKRRDVGRKAYNDLYDVS